MLAPAVKLAQGMVEGERFRSAEEELAQHAEGHEGAQVLPEGRVGRPYGERAVGVPVTEGHGGGSRRRSAVESRVTCSATEGRVIACSAAACAHGDEEDEDPTHVDRRRVVESGHGDDAGQAAHD